MKNNTIVRIQYEAIVRRISKSNQISFFDLSSSFFPCSFEIFRNPFSYVFKYIINTHMRHSPQFFKIHKTCKKGEIEKLAKLSTPSRTQHCFGFRSNKDFPLLFPFFFFYKLLLFVQTIIKF